MTAMKFTLVHGFAGDPTTWSDVIAGWQLHPPPASVALPGHGGGEVEIGWDANLDQVAAQLHGDVVVGYSLGARVALGLVVRGLAARAVLIGVNPGIDPDERDAAWAARLRRDGVAAFADAWSAQPLFASQARVSATRIAARRAARLALDAEGLARSLEQLGLAEMPDYRGELPRIGDRLALIVGGEDTRYVAIAEAMQRAAPGLAIERIAGSGHDPTLEQPGALAAAIARVTQGWMRP
jgi:2-succinyl-6-hydroxy-2,4-cyclohexadiene-1-carboxylate synthase